MAEHRGKALVDFTLLAAAYFIDRRLHVVVQSAFGDAAKRFEGMVMGIEHHLMRLAKIRPQKKRTAVTQLEVGDLQLGVDASYDRIVFAPVELEGFTRGKG